MGIFTKLEVYKPHRMKAWFWEYNVQAVVLLEGVLLNIFVSYILLGLSLAAPIGPINFAQLDQGIKNGFLHSWFVGLGAIIADAIFMLLIFFGIVHFLEIPFMQTFLWLFGFFVLVYTGIESIFKAKQIEIRNSGGLDPLSKSFFTVFFMSLFNPLSIMFWLGIYGSVLTTTVQKYGTEPCCCCNIFINGIR